MAIPSTPPEHMTFWITDVFTEKKFGGNPLAVVYLAEPLPEEQMQQIASEFGYSETSFLLGYHTQSPDSYTVRIFTPAQEIPFARHPLLGTAFCIHRFIEPHNSLCITTQAGASRVTIHTDGSLWMTQNRPLFGQKYFFDEVGAMISVPNIEVCGRVPVQEVSTGLPFLLIPVKRMTTLIKAKINPEAYTAFFAGKKTLPLYIFCGETLEAGHNIHARMFAPHLGIQEDAATGSAAGCVVSYALQHDFLKRGAIQDLSLILEQGYEMNRPSLLFAAGKKRDGEIQSIEVGGKVQFFAWGQMD